MNARWTLGIVASMAVALGGCDHAQPRTIRGQISVSEYGLHQPVVLVESSKSASYVASVSATGRFAVTIPSGQSYRLTLADRTAAGPLALVSRVLWSAKGQHFVWAKVGTGSPISFGTIRPMNGSIGSQGQNNNSQGENDDSQCDEDDDAQGDEQGPSGSGPTCQPPMQPPSNPPLCMPGGGMGNSSGDQDDNCDQDDQGYGDDDRDGNGGACGDGGVSSGDDDNQGDDDAQGNEDEDDGDGNGNGCVKHVPMCPPGAATDGGTPPPPPSGSPDMSTSGIP